MAIKTILSKNQTHVLYLLSRDQPLTRHFYFGGGTALAEFYLQHRYSEDLDFFSETDFDSEAIAVALKKIQRAAGVTKVEYEQSFNRNLFFLHLPREVIKTEFMYFPFLRIEPQIKKAGFAIDSLRDIAVNKVFTIYQKPRSRDFIDLYCIVQKTQWTIPDLVKKAKIKFDWHIDPVQLGGQFLQAAVLKDYPRMIIKLSPKRWQNFFIDEAKKLESTIFV